jgi:hypothetical protein
VSASGKRLAAAGGNSPTSQIGRRAELGLAALFAFALVAKVAVESGAPGWLLTAARLIAAASACATLALPGRRWLDGWRAALILSGLWYLPSVYGRLGGDGYEYYVLLRSPLVDGDLDFTNDFAMLGASAVTSPNGETTSRVAIGQALFWLPPFALVHALEKVSAALGGGGVADGVGPAYQAAVTAATYAYGFIGLLLIEGLLRRLFGAAVSTLTALGVWLATPLHFYIVANPFMSHGTSSFVAALFVLAWLRARAGTEPQAWAAVGLWGALLALIRPQDAVFLAGPAIDLLATSGWRKKTALAYAAGPAVVAAVQVGVWVVLYGSSFAGVVSEQNWVARHWPPLLEFFLSPRHGLLTWTPLYVAAIAGWAVLSVRDRRLTVGILVVFALAVGVNGSMADWWGSDSFGQRRMLSLTPLFALGLAASLDLIRRRPVVLIAGLLSLLAVWNLRFAAVYNRRLAGGRDAPISLSRVLVGQTALAIDDLYRWEAHLPPSLFVLAYDNLLDVWLDDGSRSLAGLVELGDEARDLEEFGILLGRGWYEKPQVEDCIRFRHSRGPRSWLRIPIRHRRDMRLTIRARAEMVEVPVDVSVEINGTSLGSQSAANTWSDLTFDVPGTAIRPGINDLMLAYSATPRGLQPGLRGRNNAVSVDWLRFDWSGAGPASVSAPPATGAAAGPEVRE